MIKSEDVKHITVPQYEGLALKHIGGFLENGHQHVYSYLPDQQELSKVPKEWICNVIVTVVGEPFHKWVKSVVEVRNKAVATKRGEMITMDADVAAAFHASTKISRKYASLCPAMEAPLVVAY